MKALTIIGILAALMLGCNGDTATNSTDEMAKAARFPGFTCDLCPGCVDSVSICLNRVQPPAHPYNVVIWWSNGEQSWYPIMGMHNDCADLVQ